MNTPHKTVLQLNKENSERLWNVLTAYRGEPLTKWELIELAEFNNAKAQGMEEIFRIAIRRCRVWAEEKGDIIPMAAPDTGYTYVLTGDPSLVVGGFYHSSRVLKGFKNLHSKHRDFIDRNSSNLPPSTRRLFEEITDGNQRMLQLEQETTERQEKLMKDLADMIRDESLEKERQTHLES